MKRCPGCGLTKPLSEWGKGGESQGTQAYCKPCQRARTLANYYRKKALNPEGTPPVSEKACSICGETKKADQFYRRRHGNSSGLTPYCRQCQSHKHYSEQYGLSPQEVAELLSCCAICGKTVSGDGKLGKLVVDHDHQTGAIRGALCHHCNLGVGYFRDDPALLTNAIRYLTRSSQ